MDFINELGFIWPGKPLYIKQGPFQNGTEVGSFFSVKLSKCLKFK